MSKSSIIAFCKPDAGWSGLDIDKAVAMLKRTNTDGSQRYTEAEVAAYMGMTVNYVHRLRKRCQPRKRKAPLW